MPQGRMAQDYEIIKVPVEPYRWNVHQYARITALAAWMFFFWRWAPPKLTRELPGAFLWPFLPSPSLFSQKELIDTDPVASDHLPSEPLTAPRLPIVKKTRLTSILFSATG